MPASDVQCTSMFKKIRMFSGQSFFYHKWSKLGRIVNVDPKDTKNTKIVKILLKGPFLGPSTIVKRPFRHYSQNIF